MYRFTIKDVENLSGVKAHTIRIWEKRYNILKPQRTDTNIRFYTADELEKLLDVCLLNKYGYKISAIAKLDSEHLEIAIAGLEQQQAQDEHTINMLFVLLAKLDVLGFERLLNDYSKRNNNTTVLTNVIISFLQKMKLLHGDKSENMEAAKPFYNIIRQKIIAGINQQNNLYQNHSILVFLPEGDYNETELLFMQFLMQKQGLHVIYLGANVPLNDVLKIASSKNPHYVYTQLPGKLSLRKAVQYFDKLSALLHQFKIVIHVKQRYDKGLPSNIQLTYSAAETLKYIS